mmetsp:Transcript_5703/g.18279  ORF Transcript_5703/g.18279 Transcript_5703/m.18279 type:complete len:201 (-) Transcript_5703:7-609(-)
MKLLPRIVKNCSIIRPVERDSMSAKALIKKKAWRILNTEDHVSKIHMYHLVEGSLARNTPSSSQRPAMIRFCSSRSGFAFGHSVSTTHAQHPLCSSGLLFVSRPLTSFNFSHNRFTLAFFASMYLLTSSVSCLTLLIKGTWLSFVTPLLLRSRTLCLMSASSSYKELCSFQLKVFLFVAGMESCVVWRAGRPGAVCLQRG